jgi:NmrA-like family
VELVLKEFLLSKVITSFCKPPTSFLHPIALAADGKYNVRVITRSVNSPAATELSSSPNITIVLADGYDETTLRTALAGVDGVFVNTNGFAIGEKAEIYWGIRIYELAQEAKVKHYIWCTIDYSSKLGGFEPKFRCGHADGKGKVAEFIRAQETTPMAWSILHSGPYMETLAEMLRPKPDPKDQSTLVFSAPLGDGAMPLICLEDLGWYGRWLFDNPDRTNGMTLKASTEHVHWADLAKTFTEVTGKKAVYKDITLDEYFASGIFPNADGKVGHSVDHDDDTLQTYRENFTGFWNMFKASGGNVGNARRDYGLLDEIYPQRVKSVGEWMRKTGYTGEPGSVLKDYSDIKARMMAAAAAS